MKQSIKYPTETKITMTVTLDATDLEKVKTASLRKISKDVKVTGFRPGKAPLSVVEKNADPNTLMSEVMDKAINDSAVSILAEEQITPLDQPKVDVKKFVPFTEMEYQIEVEVVPKVKLGDYKKLKARKKVEPVKSDEVEQVIDRMRRGMAEKKEVKREVKENDEVSIDFDGRDKDGKEVPGASGKDFALGIGSKTFIPGFEEGLVGKKAGDEFDLPVTFPKDYHEKSLAGAKVTFKIHLKSVKEVVLPELDDKFAAKCGPFKTVQELKDDVLRELKAQKEHEADNKLKDDLIEQLVSISKVPISELLVTDQINALERDFVQNLIYRGITLDQYLEKEKLTKDKWREGELKEKAVRRVQVGLVLAELGKQEDITATKEELDMKLAEMMNYYADPKMKAQFDSPEVRRDIANRVVTEKTVDRLVELNA